jgi:small subunit ribosomal protein S6
MRRYETVWVVHGDLPDEEVRITIDKFSRIIATQGGTLVGLDEWGRRKLAYKIKGTTRGYYVLADFAALPETVRELERNYRIDDRIIRYHTFKKTDTVDLEALQAEIEARAQKAAPPAPEAEAAPPAPEAEAAPPALEAEAAPPAEEAEAAPPEAEASPAQATPEPEAAPPQEVTPPAKEE